ncbi:kinase-like domain-containing protein, partial [Suillus occidentalis]
MGLELSFQTKDHICFAMDLMASDLYNYMAHHGSDCYLHACRWTAQIALGINTLHEIGIIHRDIKAGNILINARENMRISDFGLSYLYKDQGPLDCHLVYTSIGVGTICCMAPEVLHNRSDLSPVKYGTPADWWSFGCVIYELVSRMHKARFAS